MQKADEVFRIACCNCQLVHDMVISVGQGPEKGFVGIAARRNNRATAQRRRRQKAKGGDNG
jgi:hypothetical protein